MNQYALESFISFCDDMMIANESFNFKSILSKIQTVFSKLVLLIDRKVKSMKDSKIKSILLKLLSRAKRGLSKCKSLREYNPDMIDRLTQEAEEIKEEYEEVVKEEKNEGKKDNNVDKHIKAMIDNDPIKNIEKIRDCLIELAKNVKTSQEYRIFKSTISYADKNIDNDFLYTNYTSLNIEYFNKINIDIKLYMTLADSLKTFFNRDVIKIMVNKGYFLFDDHYKQTYANIVDDDIY